MTDAARPETLDRPAPATAEFATPGQAQQQPPLQQQGGTAEVVRQMEGDHAAAAPRQADDDTPLFPADEADQLQGRWQEIQASFVDEPRQAVQQADELVAQVMRDMAETFASQRAAIEAEVGNADTENLRMALHRYRSFFQRLLAL